MLFLAINALLPDEKVPLTQRTKNGRCENFFLVLALKS